jgi:hypothetical protein
VAVTLYRQIGKGKNRRYKKVNLGRGRRPAGLEGPHFLRYSLVDGARPWEPVGNDLDVAVEAQKQKQAYFTALRANVPVVQDDQDAGRRRVTDSAYAWFSELQILKGKDQHGKSEKTIKAYTYRLGFFLDFCAEQKLVYLEKPPKPYTPEELKALFGVTTEEQKLLYGFS